MESNEIVELLKGIQEDLTEIKAQQVEIIEKIHNLNFEEEDPYDDD